MLACLQQRGGGLAHDAMARHRAAMVWQCCRPSAWRLDCARVLSLTMRPSRRCARACADHSQTINEFCEEFGVPKKVNQAIIKKAKIVGSDLGFLS